MRLFPPTQRISHTTGVDASLRAPLSPAIETLGRYLLEERLGSGGMGEVFRAHDPELDRAVAIKRLHRYSDDEDARLRMLREGQAIARLSHPNIVAVYDVGRDAGTGDLFIAMELIEGMTLRQWLRAEIRSWREVAGVFAQAGDALLAAHEQGIVHRDFKPENVLVTRTGQAKVVDFGLAKPSEDANAAVSARDAIADDDDRPDADATDRAAASSGASDRFETVSRSGGSRRGAFGSDITPAGARLGTPAYMPPEQGSNAASPRADQFSFAVALFEGLNGYLPFPGEGPAEYFVAVLEGTVLEFPRPSDVPLRLQRAIHRALKPAPGDRFPTLRPLLDELRRDPAARRRRYVALGGTLFTGAAVAVGARELTRPSDLHRQHCDRDATAVASVWNDDLRGRVAATMRAVAVPFAADTTDRVLAALDEGSAAWSSARHRWCMASPIEGAAPRVHVAMGACFDHILARERELVASMSDPDAASLLNALEAIERLQRDQDRCEQPAYLAHFDGADDPRRMEAFEVLARARERLDLGQTSAGLRALDQLQLRDEPAIALEHGILRAGLEKSRGDLAQARALLEQAAREGLAAGEPLLAAEWNANYGDILYELGDLEAMTRPYERGWALRREHLGDDHDETLVLAAARGHLPYATGDYAGALAIYRGAAERIASHTDELDGNRILLDEWVAQALSHHGELDAARELTADLVERLRRTRGDRHPRTLDVLETLATIELRAERPQLALDHFRESIEARAPGDSDPMLRATSLGNIGACLTKLGRLEEAVTALQEALELLQRAGLADSHAHINALEANLAQVHKRRGRLDLAVAGYSRVRSRLEAAGLSNTTDGLTARLSYAEVLIAVGRIDDAIDELRAAQAHAGDPTLRARIDAALAGATAARHDARKSG
ncbi:MAG: protein kinase [Nannocystaceae bacterium]|nr:protein kinase [Nannocystaceae bacterium]